MFDLHGDSHHILCVMFLTQVVSFGLENGPRGVTVKMTEEGMCGRGCVCNMLFSCYRLLFLHEMTSPGYPCTADEACFWPKCVQQRLCTVHPKTFVHGRHWKCSDK